MSDLETKQLIDRLMTASGEVVAEELKLNPIELMMASLVALALWPNGDEDGE